MTGQGMWWEKKTRWEKGSVWRRKWLNANRNRYQGKPGVLRKASKMKQLRQGDKPEQDWVQVEDRERQECMAHRQG